MKIKPGTQKGKVVMELTSGNESVLKMPPFHMRRILVPMDFSEMAKKALQYAVPFATTFGAELTLVHVVQPYVMSAEIGYTPSELAISQQDIIDTAREQLDKLCAHAIGALARSHAQVCVGVPWREIISTANEINADLIILSTHGRTGLAHVLLGSVAEQVVRHASCPVLVVREKESDFISALTPSEISSRPERHVR